MAFGRNRAAGATGDPKLEKIEKEYLLRLEALEVKQRRENRLSPKLVQEIGDEKGIIRRLKRGKPL